MVIWWIMVMWWITVSGGPVAHEDVLAHGDMMAHGDVVATLLAYHTSGTEILGLNLSSPIMILGRCRNIVKTT